uniref:Uncharacterized protein n=1 Tax=Mustela putorius furo TaxID=9669 RepID=M3YKM5_MUSPF
QVPGSSLHTETHGQTVKRQAGAQAYLPSPRPATLSKGRTGEQPRGPAQDRCEAGGSPAPQLFLRPVGAEPGVEAQSTGWGHRCGQRQGGEAGRPALGAGALGRPREGRCRPELWLGTVGETPAPPPPHFTEEERLGRGHVSGDRHRRTADLPASGAGGCPPALPGRPDRTDLRRQFSDQLSALLWDPPQRVSWLQNLPETLSSSSSPHTCGCP